VVPKGIVEVGKLKVSRPEVDISLEPVKPFDNVVLPASIESLGTEKTGAGADNPSRKHAAAAADNVQSDTK
jgi:hypothetical protein